jgi:NADPH:quinone reductase-like Zn-dependent oxidoreductase
MRQTKIVVTRYGGPDVITVAEQECPAPKAGEVRVKVLAAGVSLPDVLAREGVHPETPRVPYTPGWDLVGVGTALVQLGRLAGLEMYGTCSARGAEVVKELGANPIDYRNSDFVQEIHRLTGDGVDAAFDGIGGNNLWRSREALREGGRVVVYGFQSKLHGGRIASGASRRRHPVRESAILGWYILRNWFLPGRKSMVPYSIQWLMRRKPAWFRRDLLTLFDLLQQKKIKPLITQRLPLSQARYAHELLGSGGVVGKIVLIPNG